MPAEPLVAAFAGPGILRAVQEGRVDEFWQSMTSPVRWLIASLIGFVLAFILAAIRRR